MATKIKKKSNLFDQMLDVFLYFGGLFFIFVIFIACAALYKACLGNSFDANISKPAIAKQLGVSEAEINQMVVRVTTSDELYKLIVLEKHKKDSFIKLKQIEERYLIMSPPSFKSGASGIDNYLGTLIFPTGQQIIQFFKQFVDYLNGLLMRILLLPFGGEATARKFRELEQQIYQINENKAEPKALLTQ